MKINGSDNIDEWSDDGVQVSGCDDNVAWNWRYKWIKLTLIVGSHDRRNLQLFPKMYYYGSPTHKSETTLPLKTTARMLKTTISRNRWSIFHQSCTLMSLHLFSLTAPRRVANICDSVEKIENRAERLHTSETFWNHLCQKRAYCEMSRATQILRLVPRERRQIVLSFAYIFKIMLRLLWPHETVLQTSATDIQNRKVANYFSDGVVSGPTNPHSRM